MSFFQKQWTVTPSSLELQPQQTTVTELACIRPVMTSPTRDNGGDAFATNGSGVPSDVANTISMEVATEKPNEPLNFTAVDIAASTTEPGDGTANGQSAIETTSDVLQYDNMAGGGLMADQVFNEAAQNIALQDQPPPPAVEPNIPQIPSENGELYDASAQAIMNLQNQVLFGTNPFTPMHGLDSMDPFGTYEPATPHKAPIAAYACLEFDDGFYYMNTTRLVLGRDDPLYRDTLRQEKAVAKEAEQGTNGEPRTPKQKKASKYSQSVMSQSGGFYRVIGKGSDPERRNKKKSKKSKASNSSEHEASRRNSTVEDKVLFNYQHFDEEQPAPVTAEHMPDPDHEVTLGIHPPPEHGSVAFKKISRQHARIAYNYTSDCFELEVLGGNGLFVNDQHYNKNQTMELKDGHTIQIAGIQLMFKLPDRVTNSDGGYETTLNGKQIGFDFDSKRDPALFREDGDPVLLEYSEDDDDNDQDKSSDEGSDDAIKAETVGAQDEDDDLEDVEQGQDDDQDGDGGDEQDRDDDVEAKPTIEMPEPEKKRGPGRPPKNGIMSKRQQRELEREMQEQAARRVSDTNPAATKNKVGRPRKYPRPDDEPEKTEKRKYTKRKPKDPNAPPGEGDDGQTEKKEKKERRPRSPSPVFIESELTPEQLAKPQQNYVQLIYDALAARPEGKMSLPQIYRAIIRKYPYFQLKVGTVGWQSSVRHNLSQNEAFMKVERDGKGWMWAIVPGADVTKEKKKKTPPPPTIPPQQQYHPLYQGPPPHMMHGPPPGYMHGHMPPGARPPNYPQMPPNVYQIPPHFQPSLPPPPPIPQQQNGYSSPYAQKPPQNPPPQPQPSNLGPDRRLSTGPMHPGVPQQRPAPQARPPAPPGLPGPPAVNESVGRAVESFRGSLVKSLANKSDRAELVVKSAIDRVLGIRKESLVPGDPHEDKIMSALSTVLAKMTGTSLAQYTPQNGASPQQPSPQLLHAQKSNVPGSGQSTASSPAPAQGTGTPTVKPAGPSMPSMSRPTLGGPARPSMSGMPRPPMMTPQFSRTNSGSPAPKSNGESPAPAVAVAPIAQPEQSPARVKLEPSTESNTSSATATSNVNPLNNNGPLRQSFGNDNLNDNGKRILDDGSDASANIDREVKKQNQGLTT